MNKTILMVVVLLVVAVVFGAAITLAASCDGAADRAVRVNERSIRASDVDRALAIRQRMADLAATGRLPEAPATADRARVVEQLIDDELLDEEARRRGHACSEDEARALLLDDINGGDAAAIAAASAGMVPMSYLDIPEVSREPPTIVLIEQYVTDERVLISAQRECARDKLLATLADMGAAPARAEAIDGLKRQLRAHATIVRKPGY